MKVFLLCTGIDGHRGGIETFFRECFDGLSGRPEFDLMLFKGHGAESAREKCLFNLPRNDRLAKTLGACVRRNGYAVEQLSALPSLVRAIRRERPDVIFYSDSNLGFQLFRWRKQIGVPFKLLFSNGGPCRPPFARTDFVQQVAPHYFNEAMAAGEPATKHFLVPYGIHVPAGAPVSDPALRRAARARLGWPQDRPVLISVGWISAQHKRMDYLVREIAGLKKEKPFLALVGRMDKTTPEVTRLADELLGRENYAALSVPYEQVGDCYRAADAFALASLREGFGRVYLEALLHGLPCLVHDHPVMRYVVGSEGIYSDLTQPGALAARLDELFQQAATPGGAARRREMVRARFSWEALAPDYARMFADCTRPR